MSFKKDEFISWISSKGLKSARTYCSSLRKIEREFKTDIDAEYQNDGLRTLCKKIDAKLEENKTATKKRQKIKKHREVKLQTQRKENTMRSDRCAIHSENI